MKSLMVFIFAFLLISIQTVQAKPGKVTENAIESLMMGIKSDNFGLRTSSAYMLGELKCERGVIPLLRMLKSEEREDARIVAALALLKIGNLKGIFAIKQAVIYDDSDRVRRVCANFYNSFYEKSKVVALFAHR